MRFNSMFVTLKKCLCNAKNRIILEKVSHHLNKVCDILKMFITLKKHHTFLKISMTFSKNTPSMLKKCPPHSANYEGSKRQENRKIGFERFSETLQVESRL